MARRKSLVAQLYEVHQRAKRERERAEKEYLAQERKLAAQMERAESQRQKEHERKEQARVAEQQRAERAREQAVAKAERAATQREKELQRQASAAWREEQRLIVERRIAEAEFRTGAIERRILEMEGLIQDRARDLATRSRHLEEIFNSQGAEEFVAALQHTLATSAYPQGMFGACAAIYRPEARELLVEYEMPRQNVIPAVTSYRYLKTKEIVQPEPRKGAEIKKLYEQLLARVTLRTVSETFDATPVTLVSEIVINGYVSAKDRMTGQPVRPLLISTHASREKFAAILLDEPELDPVACLRGYLNAVISPHPFDLEPIRPVLQFDLGSYKFVEEMNIVAGLDSRTDLLELKPVEFEHLIRELFEAIGMKSWVTQASRDEGVDGVAVNEDPIVGGLCVIQAKRYSKIVGLEAVHALAGVMEDKNAAKGVLVTTSWVGKASRDFAARNGRIEIIEGRHLKSLLLEHLGKDMLIGLPKLPPGWEQSDVL